MKRLDKFEIDSRLNVGRPWYPLLFQKLGRQRKIILEVIEQVNQELGTTTAVITHNAAIAGMANRVIHMRSGEITHIDENESRLSPSELSW